MFTVRSMAAVLVIALACLSSDARAAEGEEQPLETSVVEKTGARLVQIDVTLSGPAQSLEQITAADFSVSVGGRFIDDFDVDRLCREPSGGDSVTVAEGTVARPEEPSAPGLGPTTYLFYFDQPHLTMAGRQQGLDLVRQLVPELITDGNRGTLVSNGEALETLAGLTTAPEELLDALDRLEKDLDHWDPFAQEEEKRLIEVLETLRDDYHAALSVARRHYSEELWRSERDLRRFSMTLGRLATVDQPKIVIYLADTMRSNAGEHYLKLFGEAAKREIAADSTENVDAADFAFGAAASFDQAVNQASAYGVRLYTVEAQGLVTGSQRVPSTVRIQDAQNTLSGLALETGGRSFLNGVRAAKIVSQIREDLSCLYLVSFDPAGLPEDEPLSVRVQVSRPKVKTHARGRILIQSDSAALTSRLLAAYAAPDSASSTVPVRPTLIPTGYAEGEFSALVQVAVPGSEVPAATWDLGASVISRGSVRETSGRLTVSSSGAPVVLQRSMTFAPGPYEVVAVAHNLTLDVVSSQQIEGRWPKPNAELAAVGPIAVLQPAYAAIRKEDEVKTSGAVAYAEEEPVRTDRPTALVAVVCKSRDQKGVLRVERSLIGDTAVPFPETDMDLGKESCALIQDIVRTNTMSSGSFRYVIRVLHDGVELATAERKFVAWDGESLASSSSSRTSEALVVPGP